MAKHYLLLFLVLFSVVSVVSVVYAVKPVAQSLNSFLEIRVLETPAIVAGQPYSFKVHVFNGTNGLPVTTGIECYLHLYNANYSHIAELKSNTISHQFDYEFNVGADNFTTPGYYPFVYQCNNSNTGGYFSDYYELTRTGEPLQESPNGYILLVLLPLIVMGLLLFGVTQMGDDHHVLKIFVFLLIPVFFWASMHFGMVILAQEYQLLALEDLIGDTVYWVGIICGVIFTYFIIYLVYKLIKVSAQEKEDLKY